MGLGKSVELISCILAHPYKPEPAENSTDTATHADTHSSPRTPDRNSNAHIHAGKLPNGHQNDPMDTDAAGSNGTVAQTAAPVGTADKESESEAEFDDSMVLDSPKPPVVEVRRHFSDTLTMFVYILGMCARVFRV